MMKFALLAIIWAPHCAFAMTSQGYIQGPTISTTTGIATEALAGNLSLAASSATIGTATIKLTGVTGDFQSQSPQADVRLYASVNAAVTALGSAKTTLLITTPVTLTGSLTIPSTLTLKFIRGGQITKASVYTLTINGPLEAGLQQIFSGFSGGDPSDISISSGSVKETYPEWWGAAPDGVTDCTSALQQAIDTSRLVRLQMGAYLISNEENIYCGARGQHGAGIVGANGTSANISTILLSANSKGGININNSALTTCQLNGTVLQDFSLIGTASNPYGIWFGSSTLAQYAVDVAIKRVGIQGFTGTSAGINGQGAAGMVWDLIQFSNIKDSVFQANYYDLAFTSTSNSGDNVVEESSFLTSSGAAVFFSSANVYRTMFDNDYFLSNQRGSFLTYSSATYRLGIDNSIFEQNNRSGYGPGEIVLHGPLTGVPNFLQFRHNEFRGQNHPMNQMVLDRIYTLVENNRGLDPALINISTYAAPYVFQFNDAAGAASVGNMIVWQTLFNNTPLFYYRDFDTADSVFMELGDRFIRSGGINVSSNSVFSNNLSVVGSAVVRSSFSVYNGLYSQGNVQIGASSPTFSTPLSVVGAGAGAGISLLQTSPTSVASFAVLNDKGSGGNAAELDYSGSSFSGPLYNGGPPGEQGGAGTTGSFPFTLYSNNTALITISSATTNIVFKTSATLTSGAPLSLSGPGGTILSGSSITASSFFGTSILTTNAVFTSSLTVQGLFVHGVTRVSSAANPVNGVYISTTIPATSSYETILSSGNSILLTSLPTISTSTVVLGSSPVADGTQIVVSSTGAATITLQDNGTLSGSRLRLGATTRAITATKTLTLIYDSLDNFWREVAYGNN